MRESYHDDGASAFIIPERYFIDLLIEEVLYALAPQRRRERRVGSTAASLEVVETRLFALDKSSSLSLFTQDSVTLFTSAVLHPDIFRRDECQP